MRETNKKRKLFTTRKEKNSDKNVMYRLLNTHNISTATNHKKKKNAEKQETNKRTQDKGRDKDARK